MRTPFLKLNFKSLNHGQITQTIHQNEEEGSNLMIDHFKTQFYYIIFNISWVEKGQYFAWAVSKTAKRADMAEKRKE